MKSETLEVLGCPVCRGPLEIAFRRNVSPAGRLRDGLLRCRQCGDLFPVIGWVPRLLPRSALTPAEVAGLTAMSGPGLTATTGPAPAAGSGPAAPPEIVDEPRLGADELKRRIEERVRSKVIVTGAPRKLRERAEREADYRIHRTEEKGKFVRTARALLSRPPRRILDVGGGQGGALTALRLAFGPEVAMLVDLDPEWVELAWLRDPDTEVVRGDASRLPLKDDAFDLMFSTAALEHIPDWRAAVREMVRVAREGLLCYNPNAGFPYDPGHLDAPFVTWLPRGPAAYVAAAWHRLRGTGRTMESIRSELAVTHYIRRGTVVRHLEGLGVEVENAFDEFMRQTVLDDYHLRGARLLRLLRDHGWLRQAFTKALLWTGSEPNAYLYYRPRLRPSTRA